MIPSTTEKEKSWLLKIKAVSMLVMRVSKPVQSALTTAAQKEAGPDVLGSAWIALRSALHAWGCLLGSRSSRLQSAARVQRPAMLVQQNVRSTQTWTTAVGARKHAVAAPLNAAKWRLNQ